MKTLHRRVVVAIAIATVVVVIAWSLYRGPQLSCCGHRHCHCRCCRRCRVVIVTAAIATMVVVIAALLHHCRGWTLVGTAASPLARRLEAQRARGAAKGG
jgi:hypothetical protein